MTNRTTTSNPTGPASKVDPSRLTRYATAAAGVAAGAAVGVGEAAVVTSTPGSTVWTNTFSGMVTATSSGSTSGLAQFAAWGDALLNAQFSGSMARGLDTGGNFFRVGFIAAQAGGGVGQSRLASGAVIGAGGTGGAGGGWGSVGAVAQSAVLGVNLVNNGFRPVSAGVNPWSMAAPSSAFANPAHSASVRGYLAFRIAAGGGDYYYGYFDVEFSRIGNQDGSSFTMTVHSWAYENSLNQSITIGGASAVPGGAGLAALAFGAAGLRGRRRSRN